MKNAVMGLAGLAVLLPPVVAEACGPDFGPGPAYVSQWRPEGAFEDYAAGKLGVLQRSWALPYLAYAWRPMMGIPTPAQEQRQVVADWRFMEGRDESASSLASTQWSAIRHEVAPAVEQAVAQSSGASDFSDYSRIHADAFFKAGATARALAAEWKARPALLAEWVRNQDNVFGGCEPMAAAPPDLGVALTPKEQTRRRFERDYQVAAAHFYCGRFEDAEAAFQSIADSADSPYRALAAYLVARTRVRQVLFNLPDMPPDGPGARKMEGALKEGFVRADAAIQKVLDDPKLREVHGPALRLQSLVRSWLSQGTMAWSCELFSRAIQKGTGTGLGAYLTDLSPPGEDLAKDCPGLSPDAAEFAEWLQLTRRTEPVDPKDLSKDFNAAVARWKKTKHQPWLVMAMLTARADSPGLPALLTAAEKVPVSAPAGLTLAWRSVTLLRERKEAELARARLDAIPLEMVRTLPGADNLLRDERLHLARDWDEALRNAPQFNVRDTATASRLDWNSDTPEPASQTFSAVRVDSLERQLTTRRMREWVSRPWLNPALRRQLSWATFARAAVLEDDETLVALAKQLAEAEPKARAELLALAAKPTEEERRFDARLLLMGLPVVSARIEPDEDRLATVSPQLDLTQDLSYFRNGWCAPSKETVAAPLVAPLSFVSPEEKAEAAAQYKALAQAGNSVVFYSRVALDWAKAHPADPRSPIALFRVVRASKRACGGQGTKEARQAFAYLHKHYGKTEWAKRTPYVY
jgi:TolA-binding protein